MAKTVRNVMLSVSQSKQLTGMTLEEIRTQFMIAGYGVTKAEKRTTELLVSAQIQTDGRANENGRMLFFFAYWPGAWKLKDFCIDLDRIGAVEYVDARHTVLKRVDGREHAWLLE